MRWTLAPLLMLTGCWGSHGTDQRSGSDGDGAATAGIPPGLLAGDGDGDGDRSSASTSLSACDSALTLFEGANESWAEADRATASFYIKDCLEVEAVTADGECTLFVDACWVDQSTLVVTTVCNCGSGDQRNVIADWSEDTLQESGSVLVEFIACGPWRVEYSRGMGCALSE